MRIEVHLDGFVQERIVGIEGNLQAFGQFEFRDRLINDRLFKSRVAFVLCFEDHVLVILRRIGFIRPQRLQLVKIRPRHRQLKDLLLEFRHQGIKLGNLDRVVALLVFPEPKEVGVVLGSEPMKKELVLLNDQSSKRLGLLEHRTP